MKLKLKANLQKCMYGKKTDANYTNADVSYNFSVVVIVIVYSTDEIKV